MKFGLRFPIPLPSGVERIGMVVEAVIKRASAHSGSSGIRLSETSPRPCTVMPPPQDELQDQEAIMAQLQPIGERIWMADGSIVNFYSAPYPTRMIIAQLEEGALWVWSPVELNDALRAEVDALGRPAHLVSPNKIHHLFLSEWHMQWPDALLWGPASTIRKRNELPFQAPLEDTPPRQWGPDIDQAWFRGSLAMDEIIFFHRPSRTAIIADLIEAFSEDFLKRHWSWWLRPLARLDGITAKSPHAPLEWRLSFTNRALARAARDKILSWAPRQVTIAHGEWCRSNGETFLEHALSWAGKTRER